LIGYHALAPHQKVNHFPNNYELTRKDLMYKNLRRFKKQLEKENKTEESKKFNFYPQTFYMPNEITLFLDEYKKHQNLMWIMKPACKAQGRGIFIITNLNQINTWKNSLKGGQENLVNELYVVQRYIMNPLLIGGRKFDLRIYALVTNYSPLTVYLYRTGFARFTHHRYSTNAEDVSNNLVHLTNVAVQKTSDNYDKVIGGKWDLRSLKLYLYSKFTREKVNGMFSDIQDIVLKSLLSVQKVIVNDRHCFELYGYDILIDDTLKPWLIEINANPSLTANTNKDNEMKVKMLDDMLTILDLEKIMTGNEDQVGGFDIICRGNPIKYPENYTYSTMLGAYNNREKQLKTLSKQTSQRLASLYLQKNNSLIPEMYSNVNKK
jgi:tubulin polyglutamylase TTLL9